MANDELDSQYPILHKCVVIDARLHSRKEVAKNIRSQKLFEEVTEAESLSDALLILSEATIDACVVGSSLSHQAAAKLIKDGKESDPSDSCAFIHLVSGTKQVSADENSDADAIIKIPCSKVQFVEQLINGVVNANKNSPWKGVPLEKFTNELPNDSSTKVSATTQKPSTSKPTKMPPLSREEIVKGTAQLRQLAIPYEKGEKQLGPDTRPEDNVSQAIKIMAYYIARNDEQKGEPNLFAVFIEACLHEWFVDYVNHGDSTAMANFREKILQFVTDGVA